MRGPWLWSGEPPTPRRAGRDAPMAVLAFPLTSTVSRRERGQGAP